MTSVAIINCPVCGSTDTQEFLRRDNVPVHQNLVLSSREKAVGIVCGDIVMKVCLKCGFVFNSAFYESKLSYGADYDNTQSCSRFFARYLSDLAEHLVTIEDVRHCRIIEVGCGKGDFLRSLVKNQTYDNTGIGFDPSYIGPESDLDGRLRFKRSFYGNDCAHIPADIVICRHVIEHVAQPLKLLRAVRQALRSVKSPRIYFETPCVEWILRNHVVWDFFYEHCSLFSTASLRTAFEQTGFIVNSVRHVFGGQYLWLEAGVAEDNKVSLDVGIVHELAKLYSEEELRLLKAWRIRIVRLQELGPVAIWGAAAKGTTFAYLVDPKCNLVDCLVDLNPKKQGKFVPGTGHKIVGIDALASRGVKSAILMNPNYREENKNLLAVAESNVQLIEREI